MFEKFERKQRMSDYTVPDDGCWDLVIALTISFILNRDLDLPSLHTPTVRAGTENPITTTLTAEYVYNVSHC